MFKFRPSTMPAQHLSTSLREQGFLQRLCGQPCWQICSATPPGDVSTRLGEQGVLQRLCGQPCWQNLQDDAGRGRVDKTAGTGVSAKTAWAAVLAKFAARHRQRTCRQDCGNRGFCKDCVGRRAGKFAARHRQGTCRQDCGTRGFCKDCVGSRAGKFRCTDPL